MSDSVFSGSTVIIQPHKPIRQYFYRCDNKFFVTPLYDLMETNTQEKFGIAIVHGEESRYYIVEGQEHTQIQQTIVDARIGKQSSGINNPPETNNANTKTSKNIRTKAHIPNRHRRGGQSAARIMRIRQNAIKTYIAQILDDLRHCFLDRQNLPIVKALLICGRGTKKHELRTQLISQKHPLASILLGDRSISFRDRDGIEVAKSILYEILETNDAQQGNNSETVQQIEQFYEYVSTNPAMLIFGQLDDLKKYLNDGYLKVLFVNYGEIDRTTLLELKQQCEEMSCMLCIITGGGKCDIEKKFIREYNGVAGIRWFASADNHD